MTGSAHACIGAGIGSLFRSPAGAFAAGLVSHALADAVAHKDMDPRIDVPLTAAILTGIALWKGTDSPQLWGALGAVAPDLEHALQFGGFILPEDELFPTHAHYGRRHGRDSGERVSQLVAALAGLIVAR